MLLSIATFSTLFLWVLFFSRDFYYSPYKAAYITALAAIPGLFWMLYLFEIPLALGTLPLSIATIIFLASLTVTTACDLTEMLVPRYCSIWLAPFFIIFSYLEILPINLFESLLGALLGYFLPWFISWVFGKITNRRGIGEGDMELMAMIGAFLGPQKALISLNIGAISGLIFGFLYLRFVKKNLASKLPFAPALSLGALLSLFLV
ncbi:prepilin peptidase [Candidatus Dependentiae bacterium]